LGVQEGIQAQLQEQVVDSRGESKPSFKKELTIASRGTSGACAIGAQASIIITSSEVTPIPITIPVQGNLTSNFL
jgi:hypothetical protein